MDETKMCFLHSLRHSGNVSAAAQHAGIARSTAYNWRQQDAGFAAAWEDALAEATDYLALEARRRALEGVEEVRYFKGEPVGTIRRYSDALLMFLLRAYRPGVYRNPDPVSPQHHETLDKARDDLIKKLAKVAEGNDAETATAVSQKPEQNTD